MRSPFHAPIRWNGTDAAGHRVSVIATRAEIDARNLVVMCGACGAYVLPAWDLHTGRARLPQTPRYEVVYVPRKP